MSSWNKHTFADLNAKMLKGKRVCARTKAVLLRVYNYFDTLKQCGGGLGELSRTLEATGEQTWNIRRLWSERAVSRMDFSSPAKHYKSSRW